MLVAVYGTLKQGHGNHVVMKVAGGEKVGSATLEGYVMYSGGGFPVVYKDDDKNNTIAVEVYKVKDVQPLDQLEGHPRWYRRELVETPFGDAWIYIMTDEGYKHRWKYIESGEF